MKTYLLPFVILFLHLSAGAQQIYNIKFIVITQNFPDSSNVYISGNDVKLGNWDPGKIILDKVNDSTWEKRISFAQGKRIEFKFTKGTWETEALNDDKEVPKNTVLTIDKDTSIEVHVKHWKDELKMHVSGGITGHVEYIRNLESEGLKPRDIIIWLPPGYEKDTTERYAVLYMQDGQNVFDPKTSAFGTDWGIDETADSLIRVGAIRKIIVVGIYNTDDRSSEYALTDTGKAYMEFIVNKLKPLIDKKYRTLPNPESTAVGGSSIGGLISLMLPWYYPDVFSKAVCVSPAFDIDRYKFIEPVKDYTGLKKPIKIYIELGTSGLEDTLMNGVSEMLDALKEKGYREGDDLMFYKDIGGMHSEVYWRKQVWRFLEFMFGCR